MARILQKWLTKPTQDIRLTDDDFLEITTRRILSEASLKLDLNDLAPHASRQQSYSVRLVAVSVFFLLFFLIGLLALVSGQNPEDGTLCFWGLLSLATGSYAWFGRSDLLVYFNRHSGEPCLSLYRNRPTPGAYAAFVDDLNYRLQLLHPRDGVSRV